jgi:hypothetical protein
MKGVLRLALAALTATVVAGSAAAAPDSTRFAIDVTVANRVNLSVTNYGFFGNNFNSRSPSFEFPALSGYEHMARAGLWIGGLGLTDTSTAPFIGVSTAIIDDQQGGDATAATDFTPASAITHRSRISNRADFSRDALSDDDVLMSFSDEPAHPPRHVPLDIRIDQRMLGFSLPAADAFEVAQFSIVNLGQTLQNVYVGLYAQLVSGDKKAYSSWPPSSTGGPGSWYFKTLIDYDSARRLYKERYCKRLPYPGGCDIGFCPPWAGIQLLGVSPDSVQGKTVSFNWWTFRPGDESRDEDVERYAILSNGARMDPGGCSPGDTCSPIMVLSVGPFARIDPGDSIRVDYAFVGGEDESLLVTHADFAQFAHDIDYKLPSPPPSPHLLVETGERRVDFYWDASPEYTEDPTSPAPGHRDFEGYRLYLGSDPQHPLRVAQFDLEDTTGFNTGLQSVRLATPRIVGADTLRYHYAVGGLRDGFSYYGAVTSYDIGDPDFPSFESGIGQNQFLAVPGPDPGDRSALGERVFVYPNPYRVEAQWDRGRLVRDHYLWFANLPRRCVLRIFTLSGDLILEKSFDGDTYRGEGTRGLYDPRQNVSIPPPVLSGSSFAWNLITREGQAVATGLYLYAVEDLDHGGRTTRGKFLVVKSDREN